MGVSLIDSRANELRKRIEFLGRQLERLRDRVEAGTATADERAFAPRLALKVADLEEELAELLSEAPTVELTSEQLAVYFLETDRDDARGRAMVERGGLASAVGVE
jgi:hypothetical protein